MFPGGTGNADFRETGQIERYHGFMRVWGVRTAAIGQRDPANLTMSLHEPTHGRRHGSPGDDDLDVPNGTDRNGPWIHRQMDGQNQRTERPDDRPEQALSDVGISGEEDDGRSRADLEQLSAEAYRSQVIDNEDEPDGDDEVTDSTLASGTTTVLVRQHPDDHTVESTERYNEMQSHLGRRPEGVQRVTGCAVSDIAAFRAKTDSQDDERNSTVAQASAYLARD